VQGGNQFGVLLGWHPGVDVRGAHTDGDLVGGSVVCGNVIRTHDEVFVLVCPSNRARYVRNFWLRA
jgi:hypothetical protein